MLSLNYLKTLLVINRTYITDKIFDMKLYHMFQQQEFRMKYYPYIQQVKYSLLIIKEV